MPKKKSSSDSSDLYSRSLKYVEMELELSRINREKSMFVLNKAMFLYFCFLILGVISVFTGYTSVFYVLMVLGFLVLIVGSIPYLRIMYLEEKKLKDIILILKKSVK